MTPRQWIENYWYHYKWPTLAGILVLFVLLVCVVQCATRVSPDVLMMYSGPKSLSFDAISQLEASVVSVMGEDYNQDGIQYVQYLENVIVFEDYTIEDENGEEEVIIDSSEQVESYVTHVIAGDAQIYFVSPEVYAELSQQNVLTSLQELYGYVPVEAHDSCSYQLSKLDVYSLPGLSQLPEDTLVCLRVTKTLGVRDAQQAQAEHEWAAELFKSLVAYQNA